LKTIVRFAIALIAAMAGGAALADSPAPYGPLSGTVASPTPPTGTWTAPIITVSTCAASPKIDGKLDEPCWKDATHVAGFYRLAGGAPVPEQTEAWLCADKDHLYIAFHCLDSHPEQIRAGQTQRGGSVDEDDWVNVQIDSQNAHRGSSMFWVTARGTQRESLEGGTADNITWAGDWKAAAARTADGWTAEIGIPFALLRYPKGAKTFSIGLGRKLARETTQECWPYIPPAGNQQTTQYLATASGINPPYYAPRPIFLPYFLSSAGDGADHGSRQGMDIKYPITTTMTGVATMHPDFRTIEQDVASINFSYNEQYINDRRPFFAEGRGFFPADDIFYSRRIPEIDGGLKLFGKEGNTVLGFLGTTTHGADGQSDAVLRIRQEFGLLSAVALSMAHNQQAGSPENDAVKLVGDYGWRAGSDSYDLNLTHVPTLIEGRTTGSEDQASVTLNSRPGHPYVSLGAQDIGPGFVNHLGFVPETDLRGSYFSVYQFNQFDKGRIESYEAGADTSAYQHHTGGFFHNDVSVYADATNRSGFLFGLSTDHSQRDIFHDHIDAMNVVWNKKTLFQQGSASVSVGRVEAQSYRFTTISQGISITKAFSFQVQRSMLRLGATSSTQSIATGTYLLNATQTIGSRLVQQGGHSNIFFSFGQHVRSGNDIYLLFGDPNADRTKNVVSLKLIRPM
jgi:hypothetical protein